MSTPQASPTLPDQSPPAMRRVHRLIFWGIAILAFATFAFGVLMLVGAFKSSR